MDADRCRLHHKDTNFKANHNKHDVCRYRFQDVDCTTKIRILKQITTCFNQEHVKALMSIAPQRYEF